LPDVTEAVTILGPSPSAVQGLTLIDGSLAGSGADGLRILSGSSVLHDFAIEASRETPWFSREEDPTGCSAATWASTAD
jgi:hypothetical protein